MILDLLAWIVLLGGQMPDRSEADWQWLNDHRSRAFETLMPLDDNPRAHVTYRSYRDLYRTIPEQYFTIRAGQTSDTVEAVVVAPVGASVQEQLLNLHVRDPKAPFEGLVRKVVTRRLELTERTCPAVRIRLDALSKIRIPPPTRDLIVVHPVVHRVLLEFGGGSIDATLLQDDHPLVRWAHDTLKALEVCGG